MKKISTTKLSKNLDISSRELFDELVEKKLIFRRDDQWNLTKKGQEFGGETISSQKYGEFIVWPPDFDPINLKDNARQELVNATTVGKNFELSSQRINLIFAEIGWTEKALKGWSITSFGKKVGGVQFEHPSGGTYVLWPKEIINNKSLQRSINNKDSNEQEYKLTENNNPELNDFRTKFPANLRTKDGHQVRSRAEVIIDNALYDYGLAHAYERKLPIEEDVYSDFYIPSKNGGHAVYIEFWGLENDPKYSERKKIKKEIYFKYDLNLIELSDKHIENLDDHLPRMLLKFGFKVE
ncbi:MAG: hypothetical protein R3279_03230 [Putridiphycobacter sp.]|nr:hypothetical protein [Putridiphycobacter sp.]